MKRGGQATAASTAVVAVLVIVGAAVASGGVFLGADVFARTATLTQTSTTVQTQTFTLTQTSVITSITTVTVTAHLPGAIGIATTCSGYGALQQSITCTLQNPIQGQMMLVGVSDVPPVSITDTQGNLFIEIGSEQATSGYYITLYYSVARSSVPDTITVSGMGNYPSFVVHQMTGVTKAGAYSTGNGSSNTPAVSSYLPTPGSYVYAVVLAYTNGTGYAINSGPGYTQIGVYPGFISDQFLSTANGNTTSPFFMTTSTRWGEISVSLLP